LACQHLSTGAWLLPAARIVETIVLVSAWSVPISLHLVHLAVTHYMPQPQQLWPPGP
jgi:hypothetical protein